MLRLKLACTSMAGLNNDAIADNIQQASRLAR